MFEESPYLENYWSLQGIAQRLERWDAIHPEVIRKLEAHQKWSLLIEIALEKSDINHALELLPRQCWDSHDLQVARAAETSHPPTAIEIYCRRVETLIEARGRGNYQDAATILKCVKELYHRQCTQTERDQWLTGLRQLHARLPALMDELNKAGL